MKYFKPLFLILLITIITHSKNRNHEVQCLRTFDAKRPIKRGCFITNLWPLRSIFMMKHSIPPPFASIAASVWINSRFSEEGQCCILLGNQGNRIWRRGGGASLNSCCLKCSNMKYKHVVCWCGGPVHHCLLQEARHASLCSQAS